MSDNIFVTVNVQIGNKIQTVKMEKGTSFQNKGDIFVAEKDGQTVKMNNYQIQVFQAVANNYKEYNNNDIVLSKKDIDLAIKKYSQGKLGDDLGEFLKGLYKVQNPKAFKKENKISAYITNGKAATSAVLSFWYNDNVTQTVKNDSVKNDKQTNIPTLCNANIIEHKPFKYKFKKGDSIVSIAKEYEIDTYQLIAANPQLNEGSDYKVTYRKNNLAKIDSYIKEGTIINIPARYSVKENSVKSFSDLCSITGVSEGYIKDLLTVIEVKPSHPGKPDLKTYNDGYGMPTIGYGHTGKVDGKELSLSKKFTIDESKALQLLAEDILKHEAMVVAYIGKENYDKLPPSVRSAVLDVAYNKGIWDGFLNPYHNSCTSKIKSDIEQGDYALALSHTKRKNTPNRGLRRRNIYRFISGLADLTPKQREKAMNDMNDYYQTVLKTLLGVEKTYLKSAWEKAKSGTVTGYRIHTTQKDRST